MNVDLIFTHSTPNRNIYSLRTRPLMKVTYITLVGRSDWAVVNSFWAILHHTGAIPTNIHVIYKTNDRESDERSRSWTTIVPPTTSCNPTDGWYHHHPVTNNFDSSYLKIVSNLRLIFNPELRYSVGTLPIQNIKTNF